MGRGSGRPLGRPGAYGRGSFSCWGLQGLDFPDFESSEVEIQKLKPNRGERKAADNWPGQGSQTARP